MRRAVLAITLVIALLFALVGPAQAGLSFEGTPLTSHDGLYHPNAMTTDDAGNLYLLNQSPFEVVKTEASANGELLATVDLRFGSDRLYYPNGIAFGNDTLYVADLNDKVTMYSTGGTFLGTFGESGSENGQFNFPTSVAVDPLGFVYVADARNHRVQKFTPDGEFVSKFGSQGVGNGQFTTSGAAGITIDAEGNIYVSDENLHRIQKFSPAGTFMQSWGQEGAGLGDLYFPDEMAIDKDGNLSVVEAGNMRVQRFSPTGEPLGTFTGHGGDNRSAFQSPHGIAATNKGWIFVASTNENKVYQFQDVPGEIRVRLEDDYPASEVERKEGIEFRISYNQAFETCTGSGAGRITLPNDSFSIERRGIKIPRDGLGSVVVALEPNQVKKVVAVLRNDKKVEVRMTFKFDCSDNTNHTVRVTGTLKH